MSNTIELKPTWAGLMPLLVEVAANGDTVEGRKQAMGELMRLAQATDARHAQQAAQPTEATFTRSEVQTAQYVMLGADNMRRQALSTKVEALWSGGHMDMADACTRAAVVAEKVFTETKAEGWSGVCWLYEVAETLGVWLFAAGEFISDEAIKAETIRILLEVNGLTELPKVDA